MGIKAMWVAFGAATFYILGAVVAPLVIVLLRGRGVEISDETATNVTRLAALLMSAFGGAIGLRHAQKVEARRSSS